MWPFKERMMFFCDECGMSFQLDTDWGAFIISTERYMCSDCSQELVKKFNKIRGNRNESR